MQLTASGHLKRIGRIGFAHAHTDVCLHLLEQAITQIARGDVLAVLPGKGAVIHHEQHGNSRLVDMHKRQRLDAQRIAGGFSDVKVGEAGDGDQIAHRGGIVLDAMQALILKQLGDARVLGATVGVAQSHCLTVVHRTPFHTANTDTADVFVVIDVGKQNLQRCFRIALRRRNVLQNRLKQRLHRPLARRRIGGSVSVTPGSVNDRKIQLILIGTQLDEQIQQFIDHLGRAGTVAVNLIDDHHRALAEPQCLFQHETGLRHTALEGVYQQENAIHHHQDTFHLAAKIGVAGRVHDVDLGVAVHYRRIFGQDGDAALTLQIV